MFEDRKQGWVKLHKRITEWGWYKDANTFRVFLHILLNAFNKPTVSKGISYKAGEFSTGRKRLAYELDLTEQQVRTALKKLVSTKEITIKTTSQFSIISVNNWNEYQQNNQRVTNEQPTSNQRVTTYEDIQDSKEIQEIPEQVVCPKQIDINCSPEIEKIFALYTENCTNLLRLGFEKRNRQIRELVAEFLKETDYNYDYFVNVCKKANELKQIANNKIDLKSLLNNHIGIMNGKYIQDENIDVIQSLVIK